MGKNSKEVLNENVYEQIAHNGRSLTELFGQCLVNRITGEVDLGEMDFTGLKTNQELAEIG